MDDMDDMTDIDVIIIGGGAAGLSAGLVLARARRRVVVVDSGRPRNGPAARMHGFLSRDGMPPVDLLAAGRAEVRHYGGSIVTGTVDSVTRAERDGRDGFDVTLHDAPALWARRLLVATGLSDELPCVPGLRERWARDVLHCPYCHGYEVRDQRLGVLWNGPGSVRYAQTVRQWSHDVVLFAPTETLADPERSQLLARAIGVVEGTVERLVVEDDNLRAVLLDDGRSVDRDALFVPPVFVPHHQPLIDLGCAVDENGWVVTGPGGRTSVPGVRVAGNVTDPRAQVVTAAGEGSAAAIALNAELVDDDVTIAVRTFEYSG